MQKLAAASVCALTMLMAAPKDADACGGCFAPPENPTVVTDHRMIFSVSPQQTTLYDQIRYTGNPASFGWVLPISGVVTVGLSADVVFSALEQLTATQILPPPRNCPPQPFCGNGSSSSGSATGGASAPSQDGVTVLRRDVVGPYDTAQLQADNDTALINWLQRNQFAVPPDVVPVIKAYSSPGAYFLALKLLPGKGVQDMRPVRVSTPGANLTLPLRMVAAGTGPVVGISLWIVAEGRYEPQNFPSFTIQTQDLVWDWAANKSNYIDLRAQRNQAANNAIWEIESSTSIPRQTIENLVQSRFGGGASSGTSGATSEPDYLPEENDAGVETKSADRVRREDLDVLLAGAQLPRVTRLRADLARAALGQDLVIRAAADQQIISNVRQVTRSANAPPCPPVVPCPSSGGFQPGGGPNKFSCASEPINGENGLALFGIGFCTLAFVQAMRRRRK